jgi:membrane protein required for colicin V production
MNTIDIAIVVVLLVSGALGIYWGLIRQILAIAGVLAGVVLAGRYAPFAADALASFVNDGVLAQGLGFLLVFLAVSGFASLVASLLHELVGLSFLGWADHLFGGLLGVVQGVLVCAALLIAAVSFPYQAWTPDITSATLAPAVVRAGGLVVLGLLPEAYHFAVQTMFGLP